MQAGHKAVGAQVAVLGEEDRSGDSHRDSRVQGGGLPRIQDISRDAQSAGLGCHVGLFIEGVLAAAQHEQPLLHEAEVELGQGC